MKKRWQPLLAVLLCWVLFSFSAIYFFIPKAAALTLPYRWNHIPLGQPRSSVLQYLGKPASADKLQLTAKGDIWKAERNNGEYILKIQYNINTDTVAQNYTLDFRYKLGFFHKTYHLKSNQISQ